VAGSCKKGHEPSVFIKGGGHPEQQNDYRFPKKNSKSRDSSVGIEPGYGMDDRGSRVRFPARTGNFPPHHCVQNGSGAHPASYPMGTRGSFPGGKAAGA
jgi:hypothetical protein